MVASGLSYQSDIIETLDSCPLCSGNSFRRLPTPGHWSGREVFSPGVGTFGLQRCEDCSLAFVNPRPSPVLLDAFYSRDSYPCHRAEGGDAKIARFLMDCVERYGPYLGKQFLDFGCGGGFVLRAAGERKWTAFGFEVGKRALDSCHAQGLNATGNLAEFSSFSFDVVFLNHVFEHVAEPQGVLYECRRLLDKSGKLFVVVPNLAGMRAKLSSPVLSRHFKVDERYRAFPTHLFYYTAETLTRTLEKKGFRVVAVETFGLGMEAFFNRNGGPGGGAQRGSNGAKSGETKTANTTGAGGFRQIVKNRLFGAGLGESLLAVACPI
jgi:2-polyprenyl-3-methyl-5-hydroxy-6-metoxy-1,4-benzoquinol methylase